MRSSWSRQAALASGRGVPDPLQAMEIYRESLGRSIFVSDCPPKEVASLDAPGQLMQKSVASAPIRQSRKALRHPFVSFR